MVGRTDKGAKTLARRLGERFPEVTEVTKHAGYRVYAARPAGSDPEKIARLERRIQKEEEKSAAMRKREHELETEIAEHLGPEASLLDEESPSRMDS